MALLKLPWSTDEYTPLEPGDLLPEPAPTPEQRNRVAAAIATQIRDAHMLGKPCSPNHETIRSILTMDAEAWMHAMASTPPEEWGLSGYDQVDGQVRYEQTRKAVLRHRN